MPYNEHGMRRAPTARSNGLSSRALMLTRQQELDEYDRRERAFLGLAYTHSEVEDLTLFRALDVYDQIIAQTTRVNRDLAFVTGVDAAAIASNGVSLRLTPMLGTPEDLAVVKAAWARSCMDVLLPEKMLEMCGLGSVCLEVALDAEGLPYLLWHDPRTVDVVHGHLPGKIERATISFTLEVPGSVDPMTGAAESCEQVQVVKIWTSKTVEVYRDGVLSPLESGPNILGIVPMCQIEFGRFGRQRIPLCSFSAYDDVIAAIDSFTTQIRTVGTRNANPILVGLGVDVGDGAALQETGKAVGLPVGGDLKWLEAELAGLKSLLDTAMALRDQVVQTLPEFLFVDAGAQSSGLALSYRAGAFVAKIQPIRERAYRCLEWACSVVLALTRGVAWSPDLLVYDVDGGPALPQDTAALVTQVKSLLEGSLLEKPDAIRMLQGAGIVPETADPMTYATIQPKVVELD